MAGPLEVLYLFNSCCVNERLWARSRPEGRWRLPGGVGGRGGAKGQDVEYKIRRPANVQKLKGNTRFGLLQKVDFVSFT